MVPYPLLCLLVLSVIQIGQVHTATECYKCDFKIFNQCMFTVSQSVLCPTSEVYSCGRVKFFIGSYHVFDKYGCYTSDCNKTNTPLTGVMVPFLYNSTCCTENFCNGGFTARAPHLLFLGTLSSFLLYVIS